MSEENKIESKIENKETMASETAENETMKSSNESGASAEEMIEGLKFDVEKWKNDYLYLRSEFETYKRNAIKERADISKYGSERLINDILAVVDNFDRALATTLTPENIDTYSKGVKMTAAELKNTLTRFGVTEVKCEGLPFDPALHEALGAEDSESIPEGHISKVYRTAYKLHDRLIRPAQVVVAKAKGN